MSAVVAAAHGEVPGDLARLAARLGDVHTVTPDGTSAQAATAIVTLAREVGADVVLLPVSRWASEVGALVAHALRAGIVADAHTARRTPDGVSADKRELGGTWDVTCDVRGAAVVLAAPVADDGEVPDVVAHEVAVPDAAAVGRDVEVLARTEHERDGVALADAAAVVAGGRGLAGDLEPVRALADALGAAVGATRDIVEEDWIGPEAMVGQTGTMIAPRLYIGAGISGAPHHMLGMRAAEVIVAVNTDPDAPLMQTADLAIVGDAGEILTRAAELVRARRG